MADEFDADQDYVCAICDNGGTLICCEGNCRRSFHATVEVGAESWCVSLGYTDAEIEAMRGVEFCCKNCQYKRHQCFACGILGSSDELSGAEVFRCANGDCRHFYHPHCVAELLHPGNGAEAEEHRLLIAAGEQFACPLHKCHVCEELEVNSDYYLQFAICRRCPIAYHRRCLPREIAFEDKLDEGIVQRAWAGFTPHNILIFCLNHEVDPAMGTPVRNHLIFPEAETEASEITIDDYTASDSTDSNHEDDAASDTVISTPQSRY